ncbi:MAG: hypothetical protein JXR77_09965, partial [Lentisphaeria bacterium]|nr:hypothetical protein [Lentisphaeria bacterium]
VGFGDSAAKAGFPEEALSSVRFDSRAMGRAAAGKLSEQAEEAVAGAKAEVSKLQGRVDDIAAEARKLMDGKNYQGAIAKVQEGLALEGLSGEQQTVLQQLLAEIQKAMAAAVGGDAKGTVDEAKGAVDNLLKKGLK